MIFNQVTVTMPGQCAHCGAFRLDGQPPTVHFTRCGLGPDGSQVGALRAGGTRWREWQEDRDAQARDHAETARRRTQHR